MMRNPRLVIDLEKAKKPPKDETTDSGHKVVTVAGQKYFVPPGGIQKPKNEDEEEPKEGQGASSSGPKGQKQGKAGPKLVLKPKALRKEPAKPQGEVEKPDR